MSPTVDLGARPIVVRTAEAEYTTRALIIATGASARLLGLPSERALMGHGVSTCATCDGYFFRGHDIAVVGGGDSAMEEAVFLTKFASKVTIVHRRDTLRASKIMQDKARANPKIAWLLDTEVDEIQDGGKGEVTGMVVRNQKTGERTAVPVSGVFVAIGHTPNTSLFRGQLEMDANGYLDHARRDEDERRRRVRLRRRPGSRLSAGDHGSRIRLHGRPRRGAVSRKYPGAPADHVFDRGGRVIGSLLNPAAPQNDDLRRTGPAPARA